MINGQALVNLQRTLSFFAARGAMPALTYARWRVQQVLQKRFARDFAVPAKELPDRAALLAHFRTRQTPVFFFDDAKLASIVAPIPAEMQQRTVRAADRICENIFELRGASPVKFDERIDWLACPSGNVDWRWDLNRHAFFETLGRAYAYTGDERYALKFRDLLCDWLARNPPRIDQPNWRSVFEVAFRINVWSWALYYFRRAPSFDAEVCHRLIVGLLTHGRYLNANIELHAPNNHLLLEAKALAFLGILLPEFNEAHQWRARGLRLVEREMMAQVCADGVHGERAALYHRIIAGELLELAVLMENNQMTMPANVRTRLAQMIEFERALIKPDGTFPLLGDSAAADTHLRFAASNVGETLQESDYWLGLNSSSRRREKNASPLRLGSESRAFPNGGYYLMKAGIGIDARYLVFDCGAFGLPALPNHGHADALGFELYAFGQTLIIDPGFYSTSLGLEWRNYFRGTRAHNTVVVDERDQSQLLDVRRVYRPAQTKCLAWQSNAKVDFVDGMHDGYTRFPQPITHRRQILFVKPDYFMVRDLLTGRGTHCFDVYFHLSPGATPTIDAATQTVCVENQTDAGLVIAPFIAGNWNIEILAGWVSFFSGEKVAAPVLRYRQTAAVPVEFGVVLYPYRQGERPSVNIVRQANTWRIETPGRVDKFVIDGARIEVQR